MTNLTFIASFLVLAIGGVLISGYLVYQHRKEKPLVCPLNHNCSNVTESKWSRIFFFRNDTLGLVFYISIIVGIIISLIFTSLSRIIYLLIFIAEIGALLFSVFLVYLQAKVIRNYCFYCLVSAFINFLLFFNGLVLVF